MKKGAPLLLIISAVFLVFVIALFLYSTATNGVTITHDSLPFMFHSQAFNTDSAPIPGKININTATVRQLCMLPGIATITAQRIVDHRTQNGPFQRIEDIQNVKDIGTALFSKIRNYITVGD